MDAKVRSRKSERIIVQPTRAWVLEMWRALDGTRRDSWWPPQLSARVVVIMPAGLRGRTGRVVALDWGGGLQALALPRVPPGKIRVALPALAPARVYAQYDVLPTCVSVDLALRFLPDGRISYRL